MTFCKNVCPWLIKQSKQRSTWRGLALLLGATGVLGAPEQVHVIIGAVGLLLGAEDVVRDETK